MTPSESKPSAIVIEDVDSVRDRIQEQLENLGFDVIPLEHLRDPLDLPKLRKASYVVVVSDLVDSARAANRKSIRQIATMDIKSRLDALKSLKAELPDTSLYLYIYSKAPSIVAAIEDTDEQRVLQGLIDALEEEVGVKRDRIIGKWGPPKQPMEDSLTDLIDRIDEDVQEQAAANGDDTERARGVRE